MTSPSAKKKTGISRESSWIAFDGRVLDEALDSGTPLLEKVKFASIVSSNLDEFFMVKVANLAKKHAASPEDRTAAEHLKTVLEESGALVRRQYAFLTRSLFPALKKAGIRIRTWAELSPETKQKMRTLAARKLVPVLTPIGLDRSHPFPLIPNLALELLIRLVRKGKDQEEFALLEVPSILPRFIEISRDSGSVELILQEELLSCNPELLFHGCRIRECVPFRITRDMDFSLDAEQNVDFPNMVHETVTGKVKSREIIRLEVSSRMSRQSRQWLIRNLAVPETHIFEIPGMMNAADLVELTRFRLSPEWSFDPMPPLPSPYFPEGVSLFRSIRENGSILLHTPYESFDPVLRMLEEAASDPDVLAVKQTLYRIGGDSPVAAALMKAASAGKQVSVLVELKARFDEEKNVIWSQELAKAGAHVICGVPHLKVHGKMILVVRREGDGIRSYVHLSSGNYNTATARQYTDIGFFTCDPVIAADCSALFNVLTGCSTPPAWNALLVAPFTLQEELIFRIRREARLSTPENPGSIRVKVNALIDDKLIGELYRAAAKGVRIELIVRGMCTLDLNRIPKKFRKNVTVVSIVDRFLEHSRIYRFGNGGSPEYFAGSADMMPRNMKRRIEILFPVRKKECQEELDFILECCLGDRRKGRRLREDHTYTGCRTREAIQREETRSQYRLYEYYRHRRRLPARKFRDGENRSHE